MPEDDMAGEDAALKRLRMRAWRRGIREMDLILGPFADEVLPGLDQAARARFEALLAENDHDLYQWLTGRLGGAGQVSGQVAGQGAGGPQGYAALLDRIAAHAATRIGAARGVGRG